MTMQNPQQVLPAAEDATNVPTLMRALHAAIGSILGTCSLRYHEPQHGLFIEHGTGGRHSLSYRLSHLDTPIGEVRITYPERLNDNHIEQVEHLLAGALPRLHTLLHEAPPAATTSLDQDTGLATRAALDRLLALREAGYGPAGVLLIRIDDPRTAPPPVLRRVALQIAAVVGDPDRLYRYDETIIAVALYPGDVARRQFIAERIRLMVAAMPVALPAPTVTVAVLNLATGNDVATAAAHLVNDKQRKNRVIDS